MIKAVAGSLVSCDVFIEAQVLSENEKDEIIIESPAVLQYGEKIKKIIDSEIKSAGLGFPVKIKAVDKGALDYVLQARMQTVLSRLLEKAGYDDE